MRLRGLGGTASELVPEGERLPLGVLPKPSDQDLVMELVPGDVVVLSSDGLPEAVSESNSSNSNGWPHQPRVGQPGNLMRTPLLMVSGRISPHGAATTRTITI
jgi:hypothetical protein